MRSILDKIFKLPPIEERPPLYRGLRRYITKLYPNTVITSEKDDLYIYWQAFAVFVLLCLVTLPFYFSAFLLGTDVSVFGLQITSVPDKNLKNILFQYNDLISSIALWFLYPFFLFKFRWNINPKKHDFWPHKSLWGPDKFGRKRSKILYLATVCFLGFSFLLFKAYHVTDVMVLGMFYSESVFSALLFFIIVSWGMYIAFILLFVAILVLWRYVGPYEGV